jgi:DNA-directed RNA polymerase specialized sigma subunit
MRNEREWKPHLDKAHEKLQDRNYGIVEMRLRGKSLKEIATVYDMSTANADRIIMQVWGNITGRKL